MCDVPLGMFLTIIPRLCQMGEDLKSVDLNPHSLAAGLATTLVRFNFNTVAIAHNTDREIAYA